MKKMKNLRLYIIVLVALLILVYSVPFGQSTIKSVYAISAAKVKVTPNVIGQKAEYVITFTIQQPLYIGDNIFLVFPSDTLIPCSTCNPYIAAGNFTVNNVVPTDDVIANSGARTLWIKSPISVSAGGTVVVDIKKGARIANPTTPGKYQLQVATTNESYYVLSEPYEIEYSKLSNANVQLSSSIVGEQSEYTVSFTTGVLGALSGGTDSIFISFPEGTVLPKTAYSSRVSFNGERGKLRIKINGNVVELDVLENVKNNSSITIDFAYDFGIHNPSKPGHYPLTIWTTKENIHVAAYFDITDKPEVQTSVIVTPSVADGKNGWFLTQPIVVLIGTSNVSGAVSVYYALDDSNNFSLYTDPITIPNGEHTLYYYSVNSSKGLQEKVKTKKFKVDTVEPTLTLNIKEGEVVNKLEFTLTGKITSDANPVLSVNGHTVKINDDGSFSTQILLSEGNNTVNLVLEDEAGHKLSKNIDLIADSIPPKLTINSPTAWEKVTSPQVTVEGSTEPGVSLTVNGNEVDVNADGTFSYTLNLDNQGIYSIKVKAVDKAGNQTVKAVAIEYRKIETVQITLKIGDNTAILNGKTIKLDAAPFIDPKTGRTLVPLRFIVEAFKANVSWDNSLKTVTINKGNQSIVLQIGNKIAVVNGKSVALDQPPVIVNSRTMVPIRFISELLGATVKWIPENRSIIITYTIQS